MTDSFDEMRKIIKDLKSYRQDDLQIEKNLTNSNVSENENLSEDKPIEEDEEIPFVIEKEMYDKLSEQEKAVLKELIEEE